MQLHLFSSLLFIRCRQLAGASVGAHLCQTDRSDTSSPPVLIEQLTATDRNLDSLPPRARGWERWHRTAARSREVQWEAERLPVSKPWVPLGPRQTVHIKPRAVHSTGRVHFARGYIGPSTAQPDQASQCRISASEPVKALPWSPQSPILWLPTTAHRL